MFIILCFQKIYDIFVVHFDQLIEVIPIFIDEHFNIHDIL